MSVETPTGDGEPEIDDADEEIDSDTRQTLTELGEELTAIDGPLYGDDTDREAVEQLIYGMFEAVGGRRAPEIDGDDAELAVEANGEDTNWRKQTDVPTFRAECGPFHAAESTVGLDSAKESFVEIAPNGQRRGRVCIDANIRADLNGVAHEQGALHMLTPRQARSFAAALLEQAAYVDNLE